MGRKWMPFYFQVYSAICKAAEGYAWRKSGLNASILSKYSGILSAVK
jgi:hypothetical protein